MTVVLHFAETVEKLLKLTMGEKLNTFLNYIDPFEFLKNERACNSLGLISRVVHRDADFPFCRQNVKGIAFSADLTNLMIENHNMSSRGQNLRKSHAYFGERCGRH